MTGGSDQLPTSLVQSMAPEWDTRVSAARALGDHVANPDARRRLVEMLDDEDLAVAEAAAEVLVQRAGLEGLASVAEAFVVLDDQPGSYVAMAVSAALGDELGERLKTLIRETPSENVRSASRELYNYLIHEPGR